MADSSHPLDELAAYAVGALGRPEAWTVEVHLATCPPCRAELASHQETLAHLTPDAPGTASEPPPADLWPKIRAAIAPGSQTVVSVTVALMGTMAALLIAGRDGEVPSATGTGRWRPARWPGPRRRRRPRG